MSVVLSDAELARAAQSGDAVSLGLLLERHRAPLYGLALRMLGPGPDVQDAVQDAFLVALRTVDRLREPEAVGGWLRGIVRNVCLNRLKEGHRQVILSDLQRHVEASFSESLADEAIEQLAMREWVWTALAELPEVLRVTAMLRYFGSYSSYEEISTILGVPVGTVRSRLNQVKLKLADALLKTAALEHDEARQLTKARTLYFTAAYEEYNRGESYELLVSAFSEDAVLEFPEGGVWHGRQRLAKDLDGDLDVGMKVRLTNVLASKDVVVIELAYKNPPDNPSHCPPAVSAVGFYRDGEQIHRMRMCFTTPTPKRLLDVEVATSARKEEE